MSNSKKAFVIGAAAAVLILIGVGGFFVSKISNVPKPSPTPVYGTLPITDLNALGNIEDFTVPESSSPTPLPEEIVNDFKVSTSNTPTPIPENILKNFEVPGQ